MATWHTHPYSVKGHLYLDSPPVVFQAQVDGDTLTLEDFNQDSKIKYVVVRDITIGDTSVLLNSAGQTVLFGSTAGADDRGRVLSMGSAGIIDATGTYNNCLVIWASQRGETVENITRLPDGEIAITDGTYITIMDDYRVWAKSPYTYQAGANQNYIWKQTTVHDWLDANGAMVPVANAGPHRAGYVDASTGVFTTTFDASNSFVTTPGATITSYDWDFADGTPSSYFGTSAEVRDVTFPFGRRWVRLIVTDSNSNSAYAYVLVVAVPNTDMVTEHPPDQATSTVALYQASLVYAEVALYYGGTDLDVLKMIDGNTATHYAFDLDETYSFSVDSGEAVVLRRYGMIVPDAPYAPWSWVLEGRRPDGVWVTLDTRTDHTWTAGVEQFFYLWSNAVACTHYRITFTDAASSTRRITELTLYQETVGDVYHTQVAQSYVSDGRRVVAVYALMRRVGTPPGSVRAALYTSVSNRPGVRLGTSQPISASSLSTAFHMVWFTFNLPVEQADGTTYHVVFEGSGMAGRLADYVELRYSTGDAYANGEEAVIINPSTLWTRYVNNDLIFGVQAEPFIINSFQVTQRRITASGQEITFRVYDDIPLGDYPDGTMVLYWEDEYYDGEQASFGCELALTTAVPSEDVSVDSYNVIVYQGTTSNLVDGDTSTSCGFHIYTSRDDWVQLALDNDSTIVGYSITTSATAPPRAWRVQELVGSTWTTVQTVTGETGWTGIETRDYTLATAITGSAVRFVFDETNDGSGGTDGSIIIKEITLDATWAHQPQHSTQFVGWINNEPTRIQPQEQGLRRYVDLQCVDVAGRLKLLPGFPWIMNRDSATGFSSNWTNMVGFNLDRYIWFCLHYDSTALLVADFVWSGELDNYAVPRLSTAQGSQWGIVDNLAQKMAHRLTYNTRGQLAVLPDPQLLASSDRTSTVMQALTEDDITDISYTVLRPSRAHWLWGDAFLADTTDADATPSYTAYKCVAPGLVPGQGVSAQNQGAQVVQSLNELLVREGNRYSARVNAGYSNFQIGLAHGGDGGIEPARMEWVTLTITDDTAAQRGLTFTAARFLPYELHVNYDHANSTRQVTLVAEKEASGPPAKDVTPS